VDVHRADVSDEEMSNSDKRDVHDVVEYAPTNTLHLAHRRGANACSSTDSGQNLTSTLRCLSESCRSVRSGSTESLSESQLQAVEEIVAQTMQRIVNSSPSVAGSDGELRNTDGRMSGQPQYNTPDSQQSEARSSPGIRSDREVAQILALSARISEQVASAVFRDSPLVVSAARIPVFANNRIFSAAPNRVQAGTGITTDTVTTSRPISSSASPSHALPTMVVPVSRLSPKLSTRILAEIESDSNTVLHQAGQSAEYTAHNSDDSNMQNVTGNNHSANLESAHHYRSAVQSSITCDGDDVEMNDDMMRRDDDEEHDVVRKQSVMSTLCNSDQCKLQNGTRTTGNDICCQNSVNNTENERYTVRSENKTDRQTFLHGKNVNNEINVNFAANCCVYTDACIEMCADERQHTQSARSPVEPSLSYQTDDRAELQRRSSENNTTYRGGNRTAWSKISVDTTPSWSSHVHVTGSDHRAVS